MFELFAMSLREYWNEEDDGMDVDESISELQSVLGEHYNKSVAWNEPEVTAINKDDEIAVDVIDDCQMSSIHAVAAKLELDGNLDGLDLDPENPWDCDVFERLSDELCDKEDDEDDAEPEKFCHLLAIGNSLECIAVPVDLPFVSEVNINGDDDEDECDCCCHNDDESCCHCHEDGEECDCDCCCDDDNCIDIASLPALRRELDAIADALALDKAKSIDDINEVSFKDDDSLKEAKIGWYILSTKVNEAMQQSIPLIIRMTDDDEYDDIENDDQDAE